jgi:hypothetical protein
VKDKERRLRPPFLFQLSQICTRSPIQRRDASNDMKLNICIALALLGFAINALTGCASDDVTTTTTTETTETHVASPAVTTETREVITQ